VKVLHVIPSVAMRDGGPAVAIGAMTSALAAAGARVTVATTNADGASATLDVPLEAPVRERGVEYRFFARTLRGEWKFSWPLTQWLLDRAVDYDVMHVHALFSYATIPACRSARRAGIPYVVRPLGTLDPWSLGQGTWKKTPYLSLVERPHLRHAAAIHVTSESEARAVRALGYGDRARVIPLGVETASLSERAPRQAGTPPRILFLSRLHPKKGLPLLLEALGRLAATGTLDAELLVAGDGPPSYRAELAGLASDLGTWMEPQRPGFCWSPTSSCSPAGRRTSGSPWPRRSPPDSP
jgi:glycosyltransferase involved in cell wall biosynthesis